jgi:hypothetical protein
VKDNEYQCAECGGVFERGWTEEQARAEQAANGFADLPPEDTACVCEDCYQEIAKRFGLITDFQAETEGKST